MMKTMKIEPNDRTFEILKLKEINVSKMRTARLSYYEKHGGDGATATAWELFHTLIKHKLATHYQFSTMMNFCHDSDAMWKIMKRIYILYLRQHIMCMDTYNNANKKESIFFC